MSEHDFEPIRGLPGELPPGETLLWQGAPNWWRLAQTAFHVRLVAGYFALMLLWRAAGATAHGEAPLVALRAALLVTPVAFAGLGLLCLFAWLNSRTTVYSITSRRVVMRFGVAFTKAINLPFTVIEGAALSTLPKGAGDLALSLKPPNKIAMLQLWPHARPWRLSRPQPTLRAVPDIHGVAAILAQAMKAEVGIEPSRFEAPVRGAAMGGRLTEPQGAAA